MDLLGGYGSDASEGDDASPPRAAPTTGGGSSGAMAPPPPQRPRHAAPTAPPPARPSGDLFASLPQPASAASAPAEPPFGLRSLPPPTASGGGAGGGRKVTLTLPFAKELLAAAALDSDDEDGPVAKRAKPSGAKSRLMDFLPPPKNEPGPSRSGAGGGALGAGPAKAPSGGPPSLQASSRPAPGSGPAGAGAAAAAAAAGPGAGLPEGFFSNEAYRVADDGDGGAAAAAGPGPHAPHMAYGDYGYTDPYHQPHQYGGYGGGAHDAYAAAAAAGPSGQHPPPHAQQPPGGSAAARAGSRAMAGSGAGGAGGAAAHEPSDAELLEEALRAERERAGKRGGGGVKVVEITAEQLTRMDPAAREAANSAREALGTEYALQLRRGAASFEGTKLAKRKHQIGTLLFNARMQELDQLEKRTQGQKSKAETAAKYGW